MIIEQFWVKRTTSYNNGLQAGAINDKDQQQSIVLLFSMGTPKVNSSRKTVLQRERDSKINVTMPAGHTLH